MSDEQIIREFENCVNGVDGGCANCLYKGGCNELKQDILDIIFELQADIENITTRLEHEIHKCWLQRIEIEKLKGGADNGKL